MTPKTVRFTFINRIPIREIKGTLHLARLATESLHGVERVRLDAKYSFESSTRTVVIDTGTEPGRTLVIIFGGYVRREFGDEAVRMERPVETEVAEVL